MLSVVTRGIQRSLPLLECRATLTLAVIIAGWPVVRWFVARLGDGSDEPMGLFALAAGLLFAPRWGWFLPLSLGRKQALACVLAGYIGSFSLLPPLGHAFWLVAALGLVAAPHGFAFAWTTLLVLSLPLVATLQFYLGYPLRCVTTKAAALLLNFVGLHVASEGTVLHWAGERVLIDAPCSGIQMLWTLLMVSAVLANALRLGGRPTFRLFRFAASMVFLANTVRAAVLSCIEMGLCPKPPFGHDGVGIGLFAAAAAALLWRSERLAFQSRAGARTSGSEQSVAACPKTSGAPFVPYPEFPLKTGQAE